MNQKQVDWISLIALGVMIVGASFISYHYITKEIDRCGRDPIGYAVGDIDFGLASNNYSHVRLTIYADQEEKINIYDKKMYNPERPEKYLELSNFNISLK